MNQKLHCGFWICVKNKCMLAILLEIDCCLFSRFERIKALEVIIWKSQSNGNFNVKFQIHLFVSIIFCLFDIFFITVDSPPWILIWMPKGRCRIFHHCINVWQTSFGRQFGICNIIRKKKEFWIMPLILDFDVPVVLRFNAWLHWFIWLTWKLWVQVNCIFVNAKCQMPFVP